MKRVLITGGSEGIGYAFASYYASCGWDIVLAARRMELLAEAKQKLESSHDCHVEIHPIDLSDKGSGEKLYEMVDGKSLDVLINCAGFGIQRRAHLIPVETDECLVGVNVTALMTLSKLFIADHLPLKQGMIINVSSTGAFQPGPYIASYYASKSFVLSYSQALDAEVRTYGLRVYCLCPGPVDTAFYQKSGGKMSSLHMNADQVVSWCMKHLGKRCVIVPSIANQLMRFLPQGLKVFILTKIKK